MRNFAPPGVTKLFVISFYDVDVMVNKVEIRTKRRNMPFIESINAFQKTVAGGSGTGLDQIK